MTVVIADFHAHIYFDPSEHADARRLAMAMVDRFPDVAMGRVHQVPVGPHPRGSCQMTVPLPLIGQVAEWLTLNRGPFTIFAHPNTGDDIADHSAHVIWFGPSETLDLSVFEADQM